MIYCYCGKGNKEGMESVHLMNTYSKSYRTNAEPLSQI